MIQFELMFEDLHLANQSWTYTGYYKPTFADKRRVRIEICRNAYDFQSYAKAELHDGNKWNYLVSLPFDKEMNCHVVSYTSEEKQIKLFKEDAKRLLIRAEAILAWMPKTLLHMPTDMLAHKLDISFETAKEIQAGLCLRRKL